MAMVIVCDRFKWSVAEYYEAPHATLAIIHEYLAAEAEVSSRRAKQAKQHG